MIYFYFIIELLVWTPRYSQAHWTDLIESKNLMQFKKNQWIEKNREVLNKSCKIQITSHLLPTQCFHSIEGLSIKHHSEQTRWEQYEDFCTQLHLTNLNSEELKKNLTQLPKGSRCWNHVHEALLIKEYQQQEFQF
ncbi:MAG: hypothetical protein K1X29_08580 [Bdellovibrionales bacterium]|nr:hypothetical protein [Bdellovibrionales bacterium]